MKMCEPYVSGMDGTERPRFRPLRQLHEGFVLAKRRILTRVQNAIQARRADIDSGGRHCCVGTPGLSLPFGYDRGLTTPAKAMSAHSGLNRCRQIIFTRYWCCTKSLTALRLLPCLAARHVLILVAVTILMLSSVSVSAAPIQSVPLDGSKIDQVGERVMNGNEFRSVRRTVLERLPENDIDKGFLGGALEWVGHKIGDLFGAIFNFFRWLFSGFSSSPRKVPSASKSGSFDWDFGLGSLANAFVIVVIAVIVLLLVVIAAMIVKSIDAKKRSRDGLLSDSDDILSDVTTPPGELAASTYESRAMQFASTGNYRAAIRELLLGSMSWIERAGLIRYRKGLTNRDYLRSVWRREDKRKGYLTTASQFEYVYFGRRTPTAEMFEMCLASFQGAFREEEAPTAAV